MVAIFGDCVYGISWLAIHAMYSLFFLRIESVVSSLPKVKKQHLRVISQGIS